MLWLTLCKVCNKKCIALTWPSACWAYKRFWSGRKSAMQSVSSSLVLKSRCAQRSKTTFVDRPCLKLLIYFLFMNLRIVKPVRRQVHFSDLLISDSIITTSKQWVFLLHLRKQKWYIYLTGYFNMINWVL